MQKLLAVLLLLPLAAAALAFFLLPLAVRSDWFREFAEKKLSESLDAKVSINSPIELSLSRTASAEINKLSITHLKGASSLQEVSVGTFSASAPLMANLSGDYQIDRVLIDGARVVILDSEKEQDTSPDSDSKPAQTARQGSPGKLPLVKKAELRNIKLELKGNKKFEKLLVRSAVIDNIGPQGPQRIKSSLTVNDLPISLKSSFNSLQRYLSKGVLEFEGVVEQAENQITLQGRIKASGEWSLAANASGQDLSSLRPLLHPEVPAFLNYRIGGTLVRGSAEAEALSINIEEFSAGIFDGSLSGTASGQNQKFQVKLIGAGVKAESIAEHFDAAAFFKGPLNFDLDAQASYPFVSSLLESASGTVRISSENASLESSTLQTISSGLFEILSPLIGSSSSARIDCAEFAFKLDNGSATSTDQVLKLGEVFVFSEGELNFKKNELTYNFHVNSKNPALVSLIPPFRAFGKLTNPHFVPSVSGSVASVIDTAEGITQSAGSMVSDAASFVIGNDEENLAGLDLCRQALKTEKGLLSSQVGELNSGDSGTEDTPPNEEQDAPPQ